jgi:hypothetical protein
LLLNADWGHSFSVSLGWELVRLGEIVLKFTMISPNLDEHCLEDERNSLPPLNMDRERATRMSAELTTRGGEIGDWISHLGGEIHNAVGGDFNGKLGSAREPRHSSQRYSK